MAKVVSWEGDFEPDEIDETPDSIELPKDTYTFNLQSIKKDVSQNGNDKLIVSLAIHPKHKKYKGAKVLDFITITPRTGFRVKPFLRAMGVTMAEVKSKKSTVDDEGMFVKFGGVKVNKQEIVAVVGVDPDDERYHKVYKYLPPKDEDAADDATDDDSNDDDSTDDDGEEPPF